jgi:hypothetical protein
VDSAGIVDDLIRDIPPQGTYSYSGLLQTAREEKLHGAGVSSGRGRKTYLLFLEGEPEGALFSDHKGEIYGNKAVYLINREDQFTFYAMDPAVVERIVFSCRIYDKSHFTSSYKLSLPEIGKKTEGIGRLIIVVKHGGIPIPDVAVKIRRNGQIVGNDRTGHGGEVSFRLLHGPYEVLIVRDENNIDVYEFSFSQELQDKPLDLEIG